MRVEQRDIIHPFHKKYGEQYQCTFVKFVVTFLKGLFVPCNDKDSFKESSWLIVSKKRIFKTQNCVQQNKGSSPPSLRITHDATKRFSFHSWQKESGSITLLSLVPGIKWWSEWIKHEGGKKRMRETETEDAEKEEWPSPTITNAEMVQLS